MNKEVKVIIGIAVVVVIAAVVLFIKGGGAQPTTATPADPGKLVRETSHMTGNQNAKVTVVEFGDYQCPACGAADPTVEKMLQDYKSNPNFNFVFRNFPLSQHANAQISAEAAEAAGEQGKYWEMHAMIYAKQNDWAEVSNPLEIFAGYAQALGLDVNKFKSDVQGNKFAGFISGDAADGNALGVNSTPTFYINGQQIVISRSFDELRSQVDQAIKK